MRTHGYFITDDGSKSIDAEPPQIEDERSQETVSESDSPKRVSSIMRSPKRESSRVLEQSNNKKYVSVKSIIEPDPEVEQESISDEKPKPTEFDKKLPDPQTASEIFFFQKIKEFKKSNPDFRPNHEISILLGQIWKKMSPEEKMPFEFQANQLKIKNLDEPKYSISSFDIFNREMLDKFQNNVSQSLIIDLWSKLSPDEKQKYENLAEKKSKLKEFLIKQAQSEEKAFGSINN